MPSWVVFHRGELEAMLGAIGAGDSVAALPTTFARAGVAIGCMFAVFLVATAGVWCRPDSWIWRAGYGALLGAFFLHGFAHLAQALFLREYTPGVITAVVIVLPASVIVYRRLTAIGALDRRVTVIAACIAFALFIPAALLAFSIAAKLT